MGKINTEEGKKELEDSRPSELKMYTRYKRETVNRKGMKKRGKKGDGVTSTRKISNPVTNEPEDCSVKTCESGSACGKH